MSESKVALVTGASRGAGAGVARGLGELGYTVYVTGRSVTGSTAKGWDGTPLPGTIGETAALINERGGKGIAVACDHADDAQVAKVFEQIADEQGRLDILVNNAAYMHPQLIEKKTLLGKGIGRAIHSRCGLALFLCRQLACRPDDGTAKIWPYRLHLFLRGDLLHAWTCLWRAKGGP
jgi:NAD(P)-dependent dehydrogenase (short-subunit alcohol dehydrogenase family)